MSAKCNPTPKAGERNVFCPFYNRCLDLAIARSWRTWHCERCPYMMMEPQGLEEISFSEYAFSCCTLPLEIDRKLRNGYI